MRKIILILLAWVSLILGNNSTTQAFPSVTLPQVQGGYFTLDPSFTQILFSVSYLDLADYTGFFSNPSGKLKLVIDPVQDSQLVIHIPIQSLQTTNVHLTKMLKGKNWFEMTDYPEAVFTSTKVIKIDSKTAMVMGGLRLHGIIRPVSLNVHFIKTIHNPFDGTYMIAFQITGMIKRSDFGLKTYLPMVSDQVKLNITGIFKRMNEDIKENKP